MRILLYALGLVQLRKSDLNSLHFAVSRFFMKLFRTGDINIANHMSFNLPNVLLKEPC